MVGQFFAYIAWAKQSTRDLWSADITEPETHIETDVPVQRTGKGSRHPGTAVKTIILSNNQLERAVSGREMHFPQNDTSDMENYNENQHNPEVTMSPRPQPHSGDCAKSNLKDHNR